MRRKRAGGGGRKPQGGIAGKSAVFTTRITPETRAALDLAARKNKRSVSQEAEIRLKQSFADRDESDQKVRALLYLFSEASKCLPAGEPPYYSKFHLLTYRAAIGSLLDRLADHLVPRRSSAALPADLEEFVERPLRKPDAMGSMIATILWQQLQGTSRPAPGESARIGSWSYAMPNAREALGIQFENSALGGSK